MDSALRHHPAQQPHRHPETACVRRDRPIEAGGLVGRRPGGHARHLPSAAIGPEADGQFHATLEPLPQRMAGGLGKPLLLLLAAAMRLARLVHAMSTTATLPRTIGRRTEIAVRSALGAGRSRIARQLLTESVMLAVAGGVIGIVIAEAERAFFVDGNAVGQSSDRTQQQGAVGHHHRCGGRPT